jgi:hypothetical protein
MSQNFSLTKPTWALSPEFERWSLPSPRARLIKNGAKIVCPGDLIRHQNFKVLLFLASLRCYLDISVKGRAWPG